MGSSSHITDINGDLSQHTEFMAFGEILFDEHSVSITQPYLFNGKELDQETNLTYYGARYLDMKTSLWLSTDPLSGYNPIFEHEHYIDGQHNSGVFNPMNLNVYTYTYQNPVVWIDPNGKQVEWSKYWNNITEIVGNIGDVLDETAKNIAPIQYRIRTSEEIRQKNEKYGEGVIGDFKELGNNIIDLPNNIGQQIDDLQNIDINNIKESFDNVSIKDKSKILLTIGSSLISLKKGKIDTKGLSLLGNGGKSFLYVGGFKVVKETYHRTIKENILKNAGNFAKKVGNNPNVNVKKGKIILEGQGQFKGKTFETTLNAKDYLQ